MKTSIGDVMRRCYEKGWITTRDGNISYRWGGDKEVLITPAGVRKNKIEVEHIIKIKINDNGNLLIPDGVKPSGELHMHWLLLKDAVNTRSVVHVHPTHVVAAMYAGWSLDKLAKEFPEIHRYTRVGSNVGNLPATSVELGDETYIHLVGQGTCAKPEFDIVGQNNHGVCAIAQCPWDAYEHIERLDHICEIALKSGVKPK